MLRLVRCRHMYGRNISSVCCPFVVVVCVVHATKKYKKTTLILNGVLSLLYSCTKTKNEINVAYAFITTVFEPMTALIERELNGSGGVGEGEVRGGHDSLIRPEVFQV